MNGGGIEVLLIEDNADDARLVRDSLAGSVRPSIRLDWEDRLDSGMRRLAERSYDALLLDLTLADDPGLEAYLRVRETFPDLAVVALNRPGGEILGSKAVDLG